MTSKLKCPFCGKELQQGTPDTYSCPNIYCPQAFSNWGSIPLWQALIQAKQDLEISTKALKQIVCTDKDGKPLKGVVSCWLDMDELNKCIEQIEHKE